MKRIIYSFGLLLISLIYSWGQAPQGFNYQAVVRDYADNIFANEVVGIKISILQGNVDGTVVYSELHSPTTNSFGLVNLEIGNGTIILFGDLSSIDWGNSTYFLKVELDPTGGINYTDMGTSQILSVPYALHAKTAETFTGTITETDPLFTAKFDVTGSANGDLLKFNGTKFVKFTPNYSLTTHTHSNATTTVSGFMSATDKTKLDGIATGAEVNVKADWNATSGDAQILNKLTAGTGISVNGSNQIVNTAPDKTVAITGQNGITVTGTYPNFTVSGTTTHKIGESYVGGIIFYVTPDGQHGLIAETQDQSTSCTWYEAQNTISTSANHSTAGKNYTDWRLPTKNELNLLYAQKTVVGGFASDGYWCSAEYDTSHAWAQNFGTGNQFGAGKDLTYYVRAVRAF